MVGNAFDFAVGRQTVTFPTNTHNPMWPAPHLPQHRAESTIRTPAGVYNECTKPGHASVCGR
eukprot:36069-Eustigmatos_ZCMA.PRE.1